MITIPDLFDGHHGEVEIPELGHETTPDSPTVSGVDVGEVGKTFSSTFFLAGHSTQLERPADYLWNSSLDLGYLLTCG